MRVPRLFALVSACLALLSRESLSQAEGERPFIIEYVAPEPECASSEAFQELIKTEVARSSTPDRPWRFSVRIVRQDRLFEGTLTTETGVRTVTAARCDDVTAALAVIIAVAEPADSPAPPSPTRTPAIGPPLATPTISPPIPRVKPQGEELGADGGDHGSKLQWRISARGFTSTHPNWSAPNVGAMGAGSVELPWGFRKMMFELGLGASSGRGPIAFDLGGQALSSISYVILDTHACLVDLPIVDTGLSVLGCLRVAGATFSATETPPHREPPTMAPPLQSSGGALWGGVEARLRWQTPIRLFLEANVDAMYGTLSSGEDDTPGWFAAGAGIGLQI